MILEVGFAVLAYLAGSIPTAVWYAKLFHGIDIREHGSGNAGATNSLRILGKKAGITVLVIDMIKGFLPVFLASFYIDEIHIRFLIGIAAVIGHILPVFSGFRGGKGIATSLGIILAIYPLGALISVVVFALTVGISRYVSLGSLLASLAFFIILIVRFPENLFLILVGLGLFLLLVFMHRENVKRLINGNENKFASKKP
jgi:glycerol-3-phosphate acyltransferase PlsY